MHLHRPVSIIAQRWFSESPLWNKEMTYVRPLSVHLSVLLRHPARVLPRLQYTQNALRGRCVGKPADVINTMKLPRVAEESTCDWLIVSQREF